MVLRGRLFSLAFLSLLIFSPLSSVITIDTFDEERYSYANKDLGNLEPKELSITLAEPVGLWTCADATGSKLNIPIVDFSKCAPRNISWQAGFAFPSEDLTAAPGDYKIMFQWKFGETGDFAFVDATWDPGFGMYRATASFDYLPGTADNSLCTYDLIARMRINNVNCNNADAIIIEQVVVWDDISNTNIGTHDIDQNVASAGVEVAETVEICRGDDSVVVLEDASTFNCTPTFEPTPDNENRQSRWTQWVYGTFSDITTGPAANEKIIIDGVSYTNADLPIYGTPTQQLGDDFPAAGVNAPNGITDDIRMPVSANVNERFEVSLRSWNTCNPYSINDDMSPPQANPDDVFQINGPGGTEQAGLNVITGGGVYYANDVPIPQTFDIVIVAIPAQLTVTDQDICVGDAIPLLTVGNIDGGATEINWYDDNKWTNPAANLLDTGPPPNNFDPSTAGASSAAAASYSYWVTQRTGGALDCESEPVEVTLDVFDNPDPSTWTYSIVSGASQCDAVTIDLDASATTNVVPGQTTYYWEVDNNGSFASPNFTAGPQTSSTFNGLVVNHLGATTNKRRWNIRVTVTNPASEAGCQVINEGTDFFTYLTPTLSTSGDETFCSGSTTSLVLNNNSNSPGSQRYNWTVVTSGGVGALLGASSGGPQTHPFTIAQTLNNTTALPQTATYTISVTNVQDGQTCKSPDQIVVVTVNPVPPKPTISSSGSTVCFGTNVTLTSTNVAASSYQWYKGGVAVGGEINQDIVLSTVAESGSYTVEVIGIGPTNCTSPVSDPTIATINPLPTVTGVSGGGAVCSGLPAPDISWTLTGTPPFTIDYTDGTSNFLGVPEATNTFTLVAPTVIGTYQINAITDANLCVGTVLGPSAAVTLGGNAPSFDTPPSLDLVATCDDGGATVDPGLVVSLLDADIISPTGFTLNYTVDASGNRSKLFNVNGAGDPNPGITFSDAELNAVGGHTITIVSIISPEACQSTFNTPLIFTVNPRPADATAPVPATSCITGGGVALSVALPPAGNIIHWYQDAARTMEATAVGVVSGAQDQIFTPTASATATFFAVVESTTAPTSCQSLNEIAVTQTEDQQPSAANAEDGTAIGVPPAIVGTCDDTFLLNATAADNGGTGTWSASNVAITFDLDTDEATTARNIPLGTHTFTWTVTTALGVCLTSFDNYDVTRHALPAAIAMTADFCEIQPQGSDSYDVTAFDLSSFDDTVTGIVGSTDRAVTYFQDAGLTMPVVAPYTVANTNQIFARVLRTDVTPMCEASSIVTFNIVTLPDAIDISGTVETDFCEDFPVGSGIKTGIDLTDLDNDVANNQASRTVAWFDDAAYTVPVPAPGAASATNGKIFYARITETASGQGCFDDAQVTIAVNTRPADNPIIGANTQCVGGATSLYQIVPGPIGTTYTWNIPAQFTVFGGGTPADFFVLLQFGVATTQTLEVTENNPNGCAGNVQQLPITVQNSPPISIITGAAAVCENEAGVNYSVTNTANTTYAWTVPVGASIIAGQGTNAIIVNFGVTGGNVQVVPTSSGGCSGGTATLGVVVNPLPILDASLDNTVCSQADINITLAADGGSPVPASTYNVTASVTPGLIANTGPTTGNGLINTAILNDNYTNTTGGPLTITYTVTPISASSCAGPSVNVIATIDPEPIMATGLDETVCSDIATAINLNTAAGSAAAASYNVTNINVPGSITPDVGNATVANGVASNYLSNDKFTNTGLVPVVVQYTVAPVSAQNCVGSALVISATIDPEPVVSSLLDNIVCSDLAIAVTLNTDGVSVAAANYFLVNVAIPGGLTAGGGNAAFPTVGVATNAIASDTYTNQTIASLNVIYEVQGISAANCFGDSRFITVTIDPEPIMSNLLDNTVCSDDPSAITFASLGIAVPANDYNLVDVVIPVGATAAGGNAAFPANNQVAGYISTDAYTNQTALPVDVVYEVRGVSAAGCVGSSEFITLTIDPEPVIDPALANTVCSDDAISLTFNTNGISVGAASYEYVNVVVAAGLTADGANVPFFGPVAANYVFNDKYTNVTNASLTAVYEVRATAPVTGCVGDSEFIIITVNPEPVISPALNTTVCSDAGIGLNLTNNGVSIPAANYNITSVTIPPGLTAGANVAVPANGVASGYLAADTYTNQTGAPIVVTYNVQGVSGATCIGDALPILITIDPEPVVDPALDATVCSDVATGLVLDTDGVSVAAANYNIVGVTIPVGLAAGANAVVPANGVGVNYLIGDTYTNLTNAPIDVTYEVRGTSAIPCTGDSEFIIITIDPEPVIDNTLGATVCSDANIGLIIATDGTSVPAVDYNVVSVSPAVGLTAGGGNAMIPGNNVGVAYLALDTYNNPTNSPLNVTYDIQGNSAAGCTGDIETITIVIDPEPVISPTLDKTVCSDIAINLTLATNGTSVAAVNYNVKAVTIPIGLTANGGNAAIPGVGVAAGYLFTDSYTNQTSAAITVTYEVTGVSAGPCEGNSEFIIVTIDPEPVIDPALSKTICSDDIVGITLNTNGTSAAAVNYNVLGVTVAAGLTTGANAAMPGLNVGANYFINDTYENTTAGALTATYDVQGISAAGCLGDIESIIITINPEPVVNTALDATICSDNIINLTLSTEAGSTPALDYDIIAVTIPGGLAAGGGNAAFPTNNVAAGYLVNDTYTNVTNAAITVVYEVKGRSALTCLGNSEFINITIDPEPVINSGLSTVICSDINTGITLSTNGLSVGAADYSIKAITIPVGVTAGGGNAAIPGNAIGAGYIFADTYTNQTAGALIVIYEVTGNSAAGCEGDSEFINVTVNPEPVIDPALDVVVCSDDITGVLLGTNGSSVAAASYNIIAVTIPAGLVAGGGNVGFPSNGVAANYFSNDTYNNQTTGQLTVIYEVRGVSADNCIGDSELINVVIDPEPLVSATLNTSECSDVAIGVNFASDPSSIGALNYNLTGVTIPVGLTPAGTNAAFPMAGVATGYIAGDMFTNTTAGTINVTYNVEGVSAANCTGPVRSIIVSIDPEPVVDPALDATICSDLPIGLVFNTDGVSVPAANYDLLSVVVGAGLTANGGNVIPANGIPTNYASGDIYTNVTNSSAIVTYEVRGVSGASCLGDSEFIIITIDPEPIMDPGLDNTLCSDIAIGLTLNDSGVGVAASTFNIIDVTIPAGLTAAGGNAAFPNNNQASAYLAADSYYNVTAGALIVIYEVRGVSAAGCIGDSEFINMTIDPEPVINTGLSTTICSDEATTVNFNTNGTSVVAANYDLISVTIPVGLTAGANAVFPANAVPAGYIAADTYTNQTNGAINVTYVVRGNSAAACIGDNQSIVVTINPEPVINTGLDNSVCSDAAIALVLNTDGISIGASNYNIINAVIDPGLIANAGNAGFPANGVPAAYLSSDVYTNATSAALDVIYEMRGVSFSACEGDSEFVTITIEPGPIVEPALDNTVCSEDVIGVTLATAAGSVAAASYNILGITPNPSLIPGGGNVAPANGQATNYIANDTYTNTTSIPLTVIYEVKGVSAAACLGPSEFITVTIDPEPVIDANLDKTVCSDVAVGLILNTNGVSVGATTYNVLGVTIPVGVTANAGNAALPANGVVDGYLSADMYTNVTGGPLVVIYEARGESLNTCEGQSRFINITIDPEPVIDPGLNTAVCSDDVVGVTLATNGVSVAAANYNILGVVPDVALVVSGSNVAIPANGVAPGYFTSDSYTNKTNSSLNVIYEVKGVSVDGCIGDSEFITVTINPEPVVDPAISSTVCSDTPITIVLGTDATSVVASNYDVLAVTIPAGLTAGANAVIPGNGVGIGYITNDTYTNQTASPIVVIYEVRGTSGATCTGDSEFISVTINPEPVLNPALNTANCSDEVTGIVFSTNGTSVAAANYNLISVTPQAGLLPDPGNNLPGLGVVSTYIQNDKFTNTSNIDLIAQYVVEPVSPLGCVGDQVTIILTVHPEPVLDPFLSPAAVCSDVPSAVTLAVDAGSVAASFYNIVNINWDPSLIPGGANSAIGNGQAANAIAGDVYTNTTNVQKLVTYDIVPVSADNCEGNIQQVVFTINPAPALSNALDRTTCIDQTSGIILTTDGISTPAQDFEVQSVLAPGLTPGVGNVGLPVTSNNALIINGDMYTNPGNTTLTATYTIVPISAAGCRGPSKEVVLTVEPTVTAVANNTLPTICSNSNSSITLTSPTVPSAGNIVFNLTAVASSPNVSGFIPALNFLPQGFVIADFLVNTGNTVETVTYTITPFASGAASGSGCTGMPIVEIVTVEPLPIITPGQLDVVCSITATNYTILTQNNLAGTTYTWPAPTLSDPGLTGGTARGVATGTPIADTFTNTTTSRQSATYDITPFGPSGCVGGVTQLTIFVDPLPDGLIAVDQPVVCMNGAAILSFTMTVGVAPFEIVYSDGTTDFTVSNIANSHFIAQSNLTATTTYTLKSILDVNGCSQAIAGQSVVVTVEDPVASFTADITNDCTPLLVTFTNNDIQAGTQYEWNFGDGSPNEITDSPTVQHTFINNSTLSDISFNVVLTAQRTNGIVVCKQTATDFVTIKAGVSLAVSTQTTEGCSPLLVSFENNSQGVLTNKWFWREQGTTDENDVTDTFFASFVLSNLTTASQVIEIVYQGDRNGCSDEVITEVTVHPEVIADFDVAPSNVIDIEPDPTITVTNNTLNKTAWTHLWEWGDGATTTDVDPGSHTYATFGQFEIKLTISDASGNCTSEQIEVITVNPILPVVDFSVDITEGCRALTVNFTNLSTSVDPNTYMWEFRNERNVLVATSNLENPTITFFDAGRINVSLSGSNPLGITDIETKLELIEIYELPTASFTTTPSQGPDGEPSTLFLPDQLLFTNNLSGLSDYWMWDFNGDGEIDIEGNGPDEFAPSYEYESAGVYDISLIAVRNASPTTICYDTLKLTKAVKVIEGGNSDIPNGFFPGTGNNSGGSGGSGGAPNSVFLPRTVGVRDDGFEMQIFDRWGHLIFESKDKTIGWDGRDQSGKLYPMGVYVYKLDLVYSSGQQTTILGDVTLIR